MVAKHTGTGPNEPRSQGTAEPPFSADIDAIRKNARTHLDDGAVTPGYGADPQAVIAMLNEALATEIVCVLRYKRHYFVAEGIKSEVASAEFLEHAQQEQEHADRLAQRIVQLGGQPDLDPEGLTTRSHSEYVEGHDLREMIEEDLVAERIAIESYRDMVRWLGDKDPTTRRILEEILEVEEEHADDMHSLLKGLSAKDR